VPDATYACRETDETMSAGAIPVYIDTDARLPLEDVIPCRQLFVWVPVREVRHVAEYVLRFDS